MSIIAKGRVSVPDLILGPANPTVTRQRRRFPDGRMAATLLLLSAMAGGVRAPAQSPATESAGLTTDGAGGYRNVAFWSEPGVQIAVSSHSYRSGGMTRDESVCPLNRRFVPSQSATNCWVSSEYEHLPQWVWIHFPGPRRIDKVVLYAASMATSPVEFSGQYLQNGGITFDTLFHVQEARFDHQDAFLHRWLQASGCKRLSVGDRTKPGVRHESILGRQTGTCGGLRRQRNQCHAKVHRRRAEDGRRRREFASPAHEVCSQGQGFGSGTGHQHSVVSLGFGQVAPAHHGTLLGFFGARGVGRQFPAGERGMSGVESALSEAYAAGSQHARPQRKCLSIYSRGGGARRL